MSASDEYQADPIRNSVIAGIARRRLERGVKLNAVEARALIVDFVVESARDGRSVAELIDAAARVLGSSDVMDGVPEMLPVVRAVGNFPDGTFPVFVHQPIRGSDSSRIPGEITVRAGSIDLNAGQPTVTIDVKNSGDRPIQVGSHYHFFETNPALIFDRAAARGFRLDIASGTSVRFEPGQSRTVTLVTLLGDRK